MKENTWLVDEYCHLVKETFLFIQEHFDGVVPAGRPDPEIYQKTKEVYDRLSFWYYTDWTEECEKKNCEKEAVCQLLADYVRYAADYFSQGNPWETKENDRRACRNTILNCVQMIANLTVWLEKLEEHSARKVAEQLSLSSDWQVHCVHSGYELPVLEEIL